MINGFGEMELSANRSTKCLYISFIFGHPGFFHHTRIPFVLNIHKLCQTEIKVDVEKFDFVFRESNFEHFTLKNCLTLKCFARFSLFATKISAIVSTKCRKKNKTNLAQTVCQWDFILAGEMHTRCVTWNVVIYLFYFFECKTKQNKCEEGSEMIK